MIHPVCVLPSNAPPLRDDENVYQTSKVLQEHSGNRQQHNTAFVGDGDVKCSSYLFNANNLGNYLPSQQQASQISHPQPQHPQFFRGSYGHCARRFPRPESEAKIRLDADRLYSRMLKCEQYVKYRDRQAKNDKTKDEQKWPDYLEKAFFRGSWPIALFEDSH